MALVDTIRSAVATANGVTASLQGTVQHAAWFEQDMFGKSKYGRVIDGVILLANDPLSADILVPHQAIIEIENKRREVNGVVVTTAAHITFLHPFEEITEAPQRRGVIDPRDVFILPDGRSGPVVDIKGFIDAGTSAPFFPEVWLGALTAGTTI